MALEDMCIDNYPKINSDLKMLTTEFSINPKREISISINNNILLSQEDIDEVSNNNIRLNKDTNFNDTDNISVIYYKE